MRIALNAWFIAQPTTGSGQYLTHLLAEYAADHAEHQFLLCTHADRAGMQAHEDPCFEWQVLHTPFGGHSRHLAKLWFEQVSFPRAGHRWSADLLHVPYWASPLFPSAPTLVTVHDLIPVLLPAYRGGTLGELYLRLVSLSARRAALVLTDSETSRQDIIRHLQIPAARVEAVHLAADDRFRPAQDATRQQQVRLKYGLPERYLLYLGGFDVRKNVTAILKAFARLDSPGVSLVVAGRLPEVDSDFSPDPRRVARELRILDRVRFTGRVDEEDKPALYGRAIAFLFPSLYEGFGLPPLEAMACGTPVIVSDRGSLPEIVGDAGLCVAPEDTDALARVMQLLIDDSVLYEAMRRAGLVQAQRFTWRRTARMTIDAYERVRVQRF